MILSFTIPQLTRELEACLLRAILMPLSSLLSGLENMIFAFTDHASTSNPSNLANSKNVQFMVVEFPEGLGEATSLM